MQNAQSGQRGGRETRLNIRIKPAQMELIARAARLRQATITGFVLQNALQAASQIVAEEKHFEMTARQFRRFCHALDAPPAKNLKAILRPLNEARALGE